MNFPDLTGKTIAILATDGFEQIELTRPMADLEEAGATTHIVSLKRGTIQGFHHFEKAETFQVDRTVEEVRADDYDGLLLPGGVHNSDALRRCKTAISFIRGFCDLHKPVAAICHGPWTLIEAGVVPGRTLTSWPSLRTDIENAGGKWVDAEVQLDSGLVTSRKTDDLNAFCRQTIAEFAMTGQPHPVS